MHYNTFGPYFSNLSNGGGMFPTKYQTCYILIILFNLQVFFSYNFDVPGWVHPPHRVVFDFFKVSEWENLLASSSLEFST